MANIGPVGIVMKQRNKRETDKCLRCKESESNLHILTFAGSGADEILTTAMEMVQEWLDQGPSQFTLAITELIHAHRYNHEPNWHIIDDLETQQIMRHQWKMGEISLIWGFFHTDWKKILMNTCMEQDALAQDGYQSSAPAFGALQNQCGDTEMK